MSPDIQNFVSAAYGVDASKLIPAQISRMTLDETDFAQTFVKAKRCYDNSFHLCSVMQWKYVLGIAVSGIPFEHAWCQTDDGRMIDATQQLIFPEDEVQHYSLITIEPEDLFDVADQAGGFVPMLHVVRRIEQYKHLFVEQSQVLKQIHELRRAS